MAYGYGLYEQLGDNYIPASTDRQLRRADADAGAAGVRRIEAATPDWRHVRTGPCWGCDEPGRKLGGEGLCRYCASQVA